MKSRIMLMLGFKVVYCVTVTIAGVELPHCSRKD